MFFVEHASQVLPHRRYAFLIDSQGLVRWRGSGKAEQTEVDSLLRAADQLLK